MDNIIQLNEQNLKDQLSELVRGTVEETLNKLLDEEADRITNVHRMNGTKKGRIPEPVITNANYSQRPEK
jgi:hypothetical protein